MMAGQTALVIDDDAQIRRLMLRILAHAGYRAIEAPNGRLGVALFRTERPAVVVTDILMPEQEGIETIRTMRQEAPTTRIVAVSGGGQDRNMLFLGMAMELGADAVLAKPFHPDELLAAVKGGSVPG